MFRRFDKDDYQCFAGAMPFPNKDEPIVSYDHKVLLDDRDTQNPPKQIGCAVLISGEEPGCVEIVIDYDDEDSTMESWQVYGSAALNVMYQIAFSRQLSIQRMKALGFKRIV